MQLRDYGCRACREISSGDCGNHGPLIVTTGITSPAIERIQERCPSCGSTTLFVGTGGWLVCSWLKCANPCAAHDALTGASERLRADTSDVSSGPQAETSQRQQTRPKSSWELRAEKAEAQLAAHASLVQEMEKAVDELLEVVNATSDHTEWFPAIAKLHKLALLRRSAAPVKESANE